MRDLHRLENKLGVELTLSAFHRAKKSICARYRNGLDLPDFVKAAYRSRKKQTEPYAFGDTGDIQWGSERKIKSALGLWNRPHPFPMRIHPSVDEIGKAVVNGGTDPCMWMDQKYRVTHEHIESRRGRPLKIHTRSDLIAHNDYMEALDKEHHEVVIYLTDYNSDTVRSIEPGVPSNKRRKGAIEKLKAAGYKVTVVVQRPDLREPTGHYHYTLSEGYNPNSRME